MRIEEAGEFGLIERIGRLVGIPDSAVILGIGDDAAAVQPSPGHLLLATTDSQIEGHHFLLERASPEKLGRRLAAVNLSDLGAMGGQPRWALVSLVLPPQLEVEFVERLYQGLVRELGRFGASIIGGNLAGGERLVLDLTLLGEVEPHQLIRRGGAQPGDVILVTGTLGDSATGRALLDAGLPVPGAETLVDAHLTPLPRVHEGQAIARSGLATAMADISDGLAQDLGHICGASGVGAVLMASTLPISAATQEIGTHLGLNPIGVALSGGEDYELLCTAPASSVGALVRLLERETGTHLTPIGHILPHSAGRLLEWSDGRREPLGDRGWQHFDPRSPN
ncbi:MAG: thiamine-phosphate kinase [Dehalococcoidia bacterium]